MKITSPKLDKLDLTADEAALLGCQRTGSKARRRLTLEWPEEYESGVLLGPPDTLVFD